MAKLITCAWGWALPPMCKIGGAALRRCRGHRAKCMDTVASCKAAGAWGNGPGLPNSEGLSEVSVSAREGGESIDSRCPVSSDGMALGAAKSKSPVAQRESGTCGGHSWQPGSIIGMQQGIQTAEDCSVMPSIVRRRIFNWQSAKSKVSGNAATNSGVPRITRSATKPNWAEAKARLPTQTPLSGASDGEDPGAVANAGLKKVEPELGTIGHMPREALAKLEGAVRWSQNACVVDEGQGLLVSQGTHERIAVFATFSLGDALRLRTSSPNVYRLAKLLREY